MRCRWLHIALLLLLALSCRGPRLIEREEMEEIVYQMFLQDQQIKQDNQLQRQADTSLVYEGIFQSMGYNTDDYRFSLDYYLEEPVRMEKVMDAVADRLEQEKADVKKLLELEKWRSKMLAIYNHRPDTSLRPQPPVRPVDTLHVRFDGDSAYLHKPVDSLQLVPQDSLLYVQKDSL